MLFLLLFIACIWIVVTSKINTDNSVKLIALGLIAIGALIDLADRRNVLIELGILIYLSSKIYCAYFGSRKRRSYERT
jgi:hypothetical protein